VKPYQPTGAHTICQPPLGILYLASSLRQHLGAQVEVDFRDLRLFKARPETLASKIAGKYDVVGVSALSCEAEAAHALAHAVRTRSPEAVLALGGPYVRSAWDQALAGGGFDWIFDGEAERTFPRAVQERFFGRGDLSALPGLTWRADSSGPFVSNGGDDPIQDLDALPLPAWDLVPFDVYARRHNMNGSLRARRYAPLLTSRGCPYRCHYCHDIFGRRFRARSPDRLMEEIDVLKVVHGVREFQIVDDNFNLDRHRMREIASQVIARHGPRALWFTFPNGIRGDIMEPGDLATLRDMGVYDLTVAIETASPRLQRLLQKNLDIERARKTIDAAVEAGISVKAFFMLGFPTETAEEMESTIRFALDSKLTIAHFFFVIPFPGTPLYDLARRESTVSPDPSTLFSYYAKASWYARAYGVDMAAVRRSAIRRFYFRPRRLLRVLRRMNLNQVLLGEWLFLRLLLMRDDPGQETTQRITG